jgi:hypothetical protein
MTFIRLGKEETKFLNYMIDYEVNSKETADKKIKLI